MDGTMDDTMDSTTTAYNYYGGYDEESSYRNNIDIPYMVVAAVTFLLAIIGNGLVIWFGIFRMKKTVSLMWFLSLAVADFIFAFTLPLTITYHALSHWPFGSFMCKLYVFIYNYKQPIIALQLAVLSVDRCVRVAFPQWCQNHRTRRLSLIVIVTIWIISSPSSLILSIGSYRYDDFCIFGNQHNVHLYFILRSVFLLFIPFIVVCSYIGITLCSRIKHVPLCSRSFTVTLVVTIIFFVCCSPYNVLVFVLKMHDTEFMEISIYLLLISNCTNPIIYVLVGWEIKKKNCISFQVMLEKAFAEDDVYIGLSNREDRTVSLNLEKVLEEQPLSVFPDRVDGSYEGGSVL